jgi:pSer/pThr/pTyr-binding forkhead associated (FHA) protein
MIYGKLLLAVSSGEEREFILEKESITLGREKDNNIVLIGPTVSRHHARIAFTPEPVIEDLGSTFGTIVGDVKTSRAVLHSGDMITLGGARLRFESAGGEEEGGRTVIDLNLSHAPALQHEAHEAALNHTLLDVSLDVSKEASRQDATLQVVIADNSPHLVVRENGISRDVGLDSASIVIGRDAVCQVKIESKRASRRHAEVRREGGGYMLVDLDSANGTQLNGQPLKGQRKLADGDMIAIGEALIIFKSPLPVSPQRSAPPAASRRPVVVIPGLCGSELRRGNMILWPNYPYILAHPRALMLDSGPVEVTGMITEVVVVPHLIKLDAYSRLTHFLEASLGYHLGIDLLEFPYDWRQDAGVIARQLAATIKTWREEMGHGPVTVIAHSMGGLVTRYYLDQLDGRENVDHLIVMGTPHLGTAKSASLLLGGAGAGALTVVSDRVRTFSLSLPSTYEILPRYDCVFTRQGEAVDLFADPNWLPAEGHPLLAAAQAFLDSLQPRATIPTLCVVGYSRPTISRIIVERAGPGWKIVRLEMEPIGDGGVVEQSAMLDGAEVHPVRQDHGALFSDPDVHRRLGYELLGRR